VARVGPPGVRTLTTLAVTSGARSSRARPPRRRTSVAIVTAVPRRDAGPTGDTDATSARERDTGERRDAWPSPAGSRLGGCRHGGVWLAATFPLARCLTRIPRLDSLLLAEIEFPIASVITCRAVVHDNRKPERALELFETLKAEGAKRR